MKKLKNNRKHRKIHRNYSRSSIERRSISRFSIVVSYIGGSNIGGSGKSLKITFKLKYESLRGKAKIIFSKS